MRTLAQALCAPQCAGRAPGTSGGRTARALVRAALRDAGLDALEQAVPVCGGAKLLAKKFPATSTQRTGQKVPGDIDRLLVGAHHDHRGELGGQVCWGADDNAAAVAILLHVARQPAARKPRGRGVIFASFDGCWRRPHSAAPRWKARVTSVDAAGDDSVI